jgi:hypothetical protein
MRISRRPSDPVQTFGHVDRGKILALLLNREDYWQCAFVIAKGTAGQLWPIDYALLCDFDSVGGGPAQ